ncbi:MAG TPA: endonuclease/exonuclease/phosphatase family protein [Dehalococcoidia bacterium]
MRLVAWNIRAGGGRRADAIAAQICDWDADIACLSEFRGTPPSSALAAALATSGLRHQQTTAGPDGPAQNGLLIASRWPIASLDLPGIPTEPRRWLAVEVPEQGCAVCLVHIPNMVTGRKWAFLEAIATVLGAWAGGPALLVGDTNCGWPGDDEETAVFGPRTAAWLDSIEALGWRDSFRRLRAGERFFTWYSPNAGNGFRLDQAFVNEGLMPRVSATHYAWGGPPEGRREALSDHAALIVEID